MGLGENLASAFKKWQEERTKRVEARQEGRTERQEERQETKREKAEEKTSRKATKQSEWTDRAEIRGETFGEFSDDIVEISESVTSKAGDVIEDYLSRGQGAPPPAAPALGGVSPVVLALGALGIAVVIGVSNGKK